MMFVCVEILLSTRISSMLQYIPTAKFTKSVPFKTICSAILSEKKLFSPDITVTFNDKPALNLSKTHHMPEFNRFDFRFACKNSTKERVALVIYFFEYLLLTRYFFLGPTYLSSISQDISKTWTHMTFGHTKQKLFLIFAYNSQNGYLKFHSMVDMKIASVLI